MVIAQSLELKGGPTYVIRLRKNGGILWEAFIYRQKSVAHLPYFIVLYNMVGLSVTCIV